MGARELVFDIFAVDRASKVFSKVGAEATGFGAKAGKAMSEVGTATVLAGVAIGVASVKIAADYQEATTLLVTGAGESEKSIGLVRDGLLKMAPAVGIGPVALAHAMFMVESAGYHGAAGLVVMRAAAEGAKIGGADATVVANGLTTALTDYHLPASAAADITSKLVATVAAGKTTMGDLSASLSAVLPFASALGVKFNDITGAMATMTGEGIDAATSSTMLKFTMMSMANETPKGLKALKSIGMSAQQLKNDLSTKGVGGALAVVTDQIGKKFPAGSVQATHALAAIVGGTRGMGSALALTGTHTKTLIANIKSIGSATTEAGGHVKGWTLTTQDLNFKIAQATVFIQTLGVKIGDFLIPKIMSVAMWTTKHAAVVKVLGGVVTAFLAVCVVFSVVTKAMAVATGIATAAQWLWSSALGVSIVETAALKGMYLGAAIATKVATAAQWLLNIALNANPIGLVVIAIGLLVGAVYLIATKTTWFQTIWKYMTNAIGAAWRWLWNSVIMPVTQFILNGFSMLAGAVGHFLQALGHIPGFGWAKTAGNMMIGAANAASNLASNLHQIQSPPPIQVRYYITTTGTAPSTSGGSVIPGINVGHHASGGIAGGLTYINENGKELVDLPAGSMVHTAAQSARMMGGASSKGGDVHIHVNGQVYGSANELSLAVLRALQQAKGRGVKMGLA